MSVLIFHDLEGDVVAVESAAIVAIRVGRVQDVPGTVTLITVPGATLAIHEPTDEVIALWQESRESPASQPTAVYPGLVGWIQHPNLYKPPHISSLAPAVPTPWTPKRLGGGQ